MLGCLGPTAALVADMQGTCGAAPIVVGALIAAVVVYVIFVVVLRCITYEDCMLLPKGEKIAKILHIKQKT